MNRGRSGNSRWLARLVAVCGVLAAAGTAASMWAPPAEVPVTRLVTNTRSYVAGHTTDPQGYYVLARIHSYAFCDATDRLFAFESQAGPAVEPPTLIQDRWGRFGIGWGRDEEITTTPRQEDLNQHLTESVRNYEKALALKEDDGAFELGLAFILERGAAHAIDADILPGAGEAPALSEEKTAEIEKLITRLGSEKESERRAAGKALGQRLEEAAPLLFAHRKDDNDQLKEELARLLTSYWQEAAIRHYLAAFDLALEHDKTSAGAVDPGMGGEDNSDLVSYEAGKSYQKLVTARGVRDKKETESLARVGKGLRDIESMQRGMFITPIIFSLDGARPLSDLLAPGLTVQFDLDGDRSAEAWAWVRPDTAILVWDPRHTGLIISGAQLFGSATWHMFFRDGYQALDALDDNRDHWLDGHELDGLALWFDRNSNGLSEPGEVVPIEQTGIMRLAAFSTAREGISPANYTGLVLKGGQVLPTVDWITSPAGGVRPRPMETLAPSLAGGAPGLVVCAGVEPFVAPRRPRARVVSVRGRADS